MMTTYKYMCDECGIVYPAEFADRDQAWQELCREGWNITLSDKSEWDICPECDAASV